MTVRAARNGDTQARLLIEARGWSIDANIGGGGRTITRRVRRAVSTASSAPINPRFGVEIVRGGSRSCLMTVRHLFTNSVTAAYVS
jgi:hypothetical protein